MKTKHADKGEFEMSLLLMSPEDRAEHLKKYDQFTKEHNSKLRRIYREASGENMDSPPDGNYDRRLQDPEWSASSKHAYLERL